VSSGSPATERRKWSRLPLAIPVFVRGQVEREKEFLEFATALNVSAGGMLVAVRRSLPSLAQVLLEIPSAPLAALAALPKVARSLRAKVLRLEHARNPTSPRSSYPTDYQLCSRSIFSKLLFFNQID